jgi:Spy/CpxP family protein refolding chaperone
VLRRILAVVSVAMENGATTSVSSDLHTNLNGGNRMIKKFGPLALTLFVLLLIIAMWVSLGSEAAYADDNAYDAARCGYYGPGRMMDGGPGPGGYGMMGAGPMGMMGVASGLSLTDEQRAKVNRLLDEHRKKSWEAMGKVMDEEAKLRDLYAAETPDAKQVGAQYATIAKLRQQLVESNVETSNRVQALLTPEQKAQYRQWRGGWGMGGVWGAGPGPHGMMWR